MKLTESYPVKLVCETLGYARSRYYRQSRERDDRAVMVAIEEIAGRWPTYGYRRIIRLRRIAQGRLGGERQAGAPDHERDGPGGQDLSQQAADYQQ